MKRIKPQHRPPRAWLRDAIYSDNVGASDWDRETEKATGHVFMRGQNGQGIWALMGQPSFGGNLSRFCVGCGQYITRRFPEASGHSPKGPCPANPPGED